MNDDKTLETSGGGSERRAARRHKISLGSSVLITAVNVIAKDEYFVLQGQLLDVSLSGLALIISFEDMLGLRSMEAEIRLQMLLPLPSQAIELEAAPARYQEMNEAETGMVILGAQITNMSGRDRVLFMDFINEYDD